MTTPRTFKRDKGRAGEEFAVEWLRARGFRVEARNWRPPRGSCAGEIDIVASRAAEIWLFEVKSHSWSGRGECRPIISRAQVLRQSAAQRLWRAMRPGAVVRSGLLWINAEGQGIQFLENPCYS